MEAFQQKRAEFIAQEIRNFDAETLYVFLEWVRSTGHKLDRITGMAVRLQGAMGGKSKIHHLHHTGECPMQRQ